MPAASVNPFYSRPVVTSADTKAVIGEKEEAANLLPADCRLPMPGLSNF